MINRRTNNPTRKGVTQAPPGARSGKSAPIDLMRRRILVMVSLLLLWMCVIGVRLAYLQTYQHDWLKARAVAQQQNSVATTPARGLIVDRDGRELARSIDTESFYAAPFEIKDIAASSKQLAAVLGLDADLLRIRLTEAQVDKRKFAWIARRTSDDQAAHVQALALPGIYSFKEPKRFYPNGALAAHVLGFVGADETGLAGIERQRNSEITGAKGKVVLESDGQRHPFASSELLATEGQTVVLTIDQMIQYRAEQVLLSAVAATGAKSGTVVVLDPRTGEVLALANAPSFDPNLPAETRADLRVNSALQNIYEPGSTFKIVAYSAALEEKLVRPNDMIDCQYGSITVAGRTIKDSGTYGALTITDALAKSSNVAAIKLGLRLGDQRMYDYIRSYGFGAKTGVELPGETIGLLRPVARWQPSSIGSIAIGQEVGVTPLQIAAAFATVANGGIRVAPHVIKELQDEHGGVVFRTQPEQRRVISADTARLMRHMLESVTLKGTARSAKLDGYSAAGKTGTAQKIDPRTHAYTQSKHIASFVGFAPVENPAVVIAVVLDEPKGSYHGGDVAAPVFRELAEQILPQMNVAPDLLFDRAGPEQTVTAQQSAATPDQTSARIDADDARLPKLVRAPDDGGAVVFVETSDRAVLMPDLSGRSVRDALAVCAQLGVRLEARGSGRALRQFPAPGTELGPGQLVRVDFGGSE